MFVSDQRSSALSGRAKSHSFSSSNAPLPSRQQIPETRCSVLGLAEDREVLGLAIDYTSTVEQLYIDTAIKILEAKPVVRFLFK